MNHKKTYIFDGDMVLDGRATRKLYWKLKDAMTL